MPAPDATLDVRGARCPLPVLKAHKALKNVKAGGVLEVWADDAAAEGDFKAYCANSGHRLLGVVPVAGESRKFTLQKT